MISGLSLRLARVLVGEEMEYDAWDESKGAFARSLGLTPPPMRGLRPPDIRSWARWVRARAVIRIVPIEVPSSRLAVEQGRGCLRKTVNEVARPSFICRVEYDRVAFTQMGLSKVILTSKSSV